MLLVRRISDKVNFREDEGEGEAVGVELGDGEAVRGDVGGVIDGDRVTLTSFFTKSIASLVSLV